MPTTRRQVLKAGGLATAGLFLSPSASARVRASSAPPPSVVGATSSVARTLSTWFTGNRVHGFINLVPCVWLDEPEFEAAGAEFEQMGAKVITRLFKRGYEDPWWPSALPLGPDGKPLLDRDRTVECPEAVGREHFLPKGRNVAQEIIDDAHEHGLKAVAYYWHQSELTLEEMHPEWVCRLPDGTPIPGPGPETNSRGIYLDMTGPFGDIVLTRLLELVEFGVDGFFLDAQHLPPQGAWGSPLEEAWTAETGRPAPTGGWTAETPVFDETDVDYREFLHFRARKIEDVFAHWHNELHSANPDVVLVVSDPTLSALTDPRTTSRLAVIADSLKHEFDFANTDSRNKFVFVDNPDLAQPSRHVQQSLGWTVMRDAADGRPPHVWTGAVPNGDHELGFISHLTAHGCIANVNVHESTFFGGNVDRRYAPREALEAAFAFGDLISSHVAGITPLRWAACHFSENSREARGGNYRLAWEEVLWPLTGGYAVLTESGAPVGVVTDDQLADGRLDGYRLLFLPNADELSVAQQAAVDTFVDDGGVVIENDPTWLWSDPSGTADAADAMRAVTAPHLSSAPVQVAGRPEGSFAISHVRDDGLTTATLVAAVTNDLTWVQTRQADGVPPGSDINPPAPPATEIELTWRAGHGLPETPRAVEAVTGTELTISQTDGEFRVELPPVEYLALVVVSSASFDDITRRVDAFVETGKVSQIERRRLIALLSAADRLVGINKYRAAARVLDQFIEAAHRVADDSTAAELVATAEALARWLTDR